MTTWSLRVNCFRRTAHRINPAQLILSARQNAECSYGQSHQPMTIVPGIPETAATCATHQA